MRTIMSYAIVLLSMPAALVAQTGDIRRVHDPVMIQEKGTYYVFSSGPGVPVRRSKDLVHWESAGRVFKENVPAWGKKEIPGADGVWAPDISYWNGRFHLYYAVSTVGSQRSCIGLATNRTLDASSSDFAWTDHGKVLETFPGQMDYNAIDANLVLDEKNRPWLVLGSFWGGIKMVALDPATGIRDTKQDQIHALAAKPGNNAIEGAFLVRKGEWFFLFVSFDHCCRGVASNYKVVVGRSRQITGPYLDYTGRPMLEGGGSLVLAGYDAWRGPGHNGILLGPQADWFVHHMYDVHEKGKPTLQIRPLLWTEDQWPLIGEPLTEVPSTRERAKSSDLPGVWKHIVNDGADHYFELQPGGKLFAAVPGATWTLEDATLRLRWPERNAPGGAWVDTCILAPDGKSYVGRNLAGNLIRGLRQ